MHNKNVIRMICFCVILLFVGQTSIVLAVDALAVEKDNGDAWVVTTEPICPGITCEDTCSGPTCEDTCEGGDTCYMVPTCYPWLTCPSPTCIGDYTCEGLTCGGILPTCEDTCSGDTCEDTCSGDGVDGEEGVTIGVSCGWVGGPCPTTEGDTCEDTCDYTCSCDPPGPTTEDTCEDTCSGDGVDGEEGVTIGVSCGWVGGPCPTTEDTCEDTCEYTCEVSCGWVGGPCPTTETVCDGGETCGYNCDDTCDDCSGDDENANSGNSDNLLYNTPIQRFGANTFFNSLFNLMSSYLSGISFDSPLFSFQTARSIGGTFATIQTSYLGK